MSAIFKTGGKQYSVKEGQILKVEKINGKKGDSLSFDNILAIRDEKNNITIGTPKITGAIIKATILDQIRNKKIIVFNKRRRKNYRLTQGHRQYLTVLKIESILGADKKASTSSIKKASKSSISDKIKVKEKETNNKNKEINKVITKKAKKTVVKKQQTTKKKLVKKTTKSKK